MNDHPLDVGSRLNGPDDPLLRGARTPLQVLRSHRTHLGNLTTAMTIAAAHIEADDPRQALGKLRSVRRQLDAIITEADPDG